MTWHELGATVTLTLAGASDDDVDLLVTAPDGTESTPSTSYSSPNWSASVTADQYDTWLYTWIVDGVAVEQGSFNVGGPWYGTLAALKFDAGKISSDTSADAALARNLLAASRKVEEHCDGRPIGAFLLDSVASARTFSTRHAICTDDGYRLPVDDIGHATITVEVGDGTTWTTLTDVEGYPDNAITKNEAITALVSQTDWRQYRRARVTARWGWPAVPSGVVTATLLHALRLYKRPGSPEGVAGSAEWGLVRIPNLDPDVQSHLKQWHTPWHGR